MQDYLKNLPDHMFIRDLSDILLSAENLEDLVRPMLVIFKEITGLETTYFTQIDVENNVQSVLYANSSQSLNITEGMAAPWGDTLCKRALDSDTFATNQVGDCWGDSEAARALGINTYLSAPIYIENQKLYGTLCAASVESKHLDAIPMPLVSLFAHLIARQIERDMLINLLKLQNTDLALLSQLDPLTGLYNRRGLEKELGQMLKTARRLAVHVQLVFIDLDRFKAINDTHGHDIGDLFLRQMARHLQESLREGDLLARYGGDEFIIASLAAEGAKRDDEELRKRIAKLTQKSFDLNGLVLDYAGASVGLAASLPDETDAEALIARADDAMYQIKQARRAV